MFYLLFFLGAGLIVGSFLNVVFIRTEREEDYIGGRSHCDTCSTTLAWYDNIPVLSYLFLGGKCRSCKALIPSQHLWFELGTGGAFLWVVSLFFDPLSPETWLTTLWLCILVSLCILIVVSDVVSMEIPLVFLVSSAIVTALYVAAHFWFFERQLPFLETPLWNSALGGLCAWAFFFLLVYFSKETWMGWGDVWIALTGGMAVGVKFTLLMLTTAFASGALFGLSLLFWHKKNLQTQVPFAPFLVLGILCILSIEQVRPEWLRFFMW
jgi:prepilin signal peptidase PulO-like enzyme (type II secretory pathway)